MRFSVTESPEFTLTESKNGNVLDNFSIEETVQGSPSEMVPMG